MQKESALNRKVKLSAELSEFMGSAEASRTEVTKRVWEYIKANDLQDPANRRIIRPDQSLSRILGSQPVDMMKMSGLLNGHFMK